MTEEYTNRILDRIEGLENKIEGIRYEISLLKLEIKSEMQLKHEQLTSVDREHTEKLSLLEKIVFGAVGLITIGFIGSLATLVFKQ
jgi:hypothetical protein